MLAIETEQSSVLELNSPAAKCRGVDLRPAVSRALTVFGLTNAFTLARSPVLQASKSSRNGSPPPPDLGSESTAFVVSVDLRPAISSHRHFHVVAPSDDDSRDRDAIAKDRHISHSAQRCPTTRTQAESTLRLRRTDRRTGERVAREAIGDISHFRTHRGRSTIPRYVTASDFSRSSAGIWW